jgi:hypothetical protein
MPDASVIEGGDLSPMQSTKFKPVPLTVSPVGAHSEEQDRSVLISLIINFECIVFST